MKFKITIYEKNSKGKEQITQCEIFETREEAANFILKHKAMPKEYKRTHDNPHFTYDGTN